MREGLFTEERKLIQRFIQLEGVLTEKEVLQFIQHLQSLILKKRIRKTSPFADEIMFIQKQLVRVYNSMDKSVKVRLSNEATRRMRRALIQMILWKVTHALPQGHIEGNAKLNDIVLMPDTSGGAYDFYLHNIYIGEDELYIPKELEWVIRHEIGHAVHQQNKKLVDSWLTSRWGWWWSSPTYKGINTWVEDMKGWNQCTSKQKKDIATIVRKWLGKGGWNPPKQPRVAKAHLWNTPWFAPRLAAENSKEEWYTHNHLWYRAEGKAFFLNYYFTELTSVSLSTLDFINTRMPNKYAAMAPLEFFAELYALYYTIGHPHRKYIPGDAMEWFERHLGAATQIN